MASEPIPVLVTAIGGGGHGEQIVKALRAAGPDRYWIVGGDASRFCPQFGMVDQPVLLPRANHPDYIEAVLAICERFGVRAAFHGCEPELLAFHRHRDRFAAASIFLPVNPPSAIETCMDKFATARFLAVNGFQPPWSEAFTGPESIERVPVYPVIVKPMRGGGGSRDCFTFRTRTAAARASRCWSVSGWPRRDESMVRSAGANAAGRGTDPSFGVGEQDDIRRYGRLHQVQVHGLRRGLPRGLFLRG